MEDKIIIYYNPSCSKCRETLAILENSGKEFEIIDYRKVLLTGDELRELFKKLGLSVHDILRKDEPLAINLKLIKRKLTDDELIDIVVKNPILIQRPIVVRGEKALLCRPPENVMKLL